MSYNPDIPIVTNIKKDTKNYMILMNAKSEFVYNATLSNPFNTTHFAWIDFGICHILDTLNTNLDTINTMLSNLYNVSKLNLKDNFLLFPSCFSKDESRLRMHNIDKTINWRFCGGLFIGDKISIKDMHFRMLDKIPLFIQKTNVIVWEVNIWAWLEHSYDWNVDSYIADHNYTMLNIPLENLYCLHKYIDKVFYINLEHRTDRRKEIENELNNYNITYERFNAISTPDFGIVGCTKSHLEVLKIARTRKYKKVLILEDDFMFLVNKEEFEKQIELLFNTNINTKAIDFDVCMLSYNLIKGEVCETIPFLTKVLDAQTASGYIVNETIYDRLIAIYENAIPLLESTKKHWIYANDQIWKQLQLTSNWYCFTKRLGKQRASYSDNDKSFCDYNL